MRNFVITVNGKTYQVGVEEVGGTATPVAVAPVAAAPVAPVAAPVAAKATPANGEKVLSPFPGLIKNLLVADGATVKATGTAQVVSETFSASGTITVDASEIDAETLQKGDVAVLTVPADQVPPNVEWPPYSPIKNVRTKWMLDGDGKTKTLYFGKVIGLKLIIR